MHSQRPRMLLAEMISQGETCNPRKFDALMPIVSSDEYERERQREFSKVNERPFSSESIAAQRRRSRGISGTEFESAPAGHFRQLE